MQKRLGRRQLLRQSLTIGAGALLVAGCDGGNGAAAVSAELAARIHAEYGLGDVVLCDGYVLARTEAELFGQAHRC